MSWDAVGYQGRGVGIEIAKIARIGNRRKLKPQSLTTEGDSTQYAASQVIAEIGKERNLPLITLMARIRSRVIG